MKTLLEKLKSRKLWAALLGIVTGVAMVFGVDGSTVTEVAGAVVALVSAVTYIITEGRIDAAAVDTVSTSAETIKDAVADAVTDTADEDDNVIGVTE